VKPLDEIVSETVAARKAGLWLLGAFAFGALGARWNRNLWRCVLFALRSASPNSAFGSRSALAMAMFLAESAENFALHYRGPDSHSAWRARWRFSKTARQAFLYSVSPTDASTFTVVPVFLALVALTASYLPARAAAAKSGPDSGAAL